MASDDSTRGWQADTASIPDHAHDSNQCSDPRRSRERSAMERTRVPGIYRRGSKFVVVWRHDGRQRKETHETFAEAQAARARHKAGDTRPRGRGRLLLAHYARDWVDLSPGATGRGLADSTRKDYRRSLEAYIIPALGDYCLPDIRPRDIRRLVRSLEQRGQKPSTVRKNIAPLRTMLNAAVEDGDLQYNPAVAVRVASYRSDLPAESELPKALKRGEIHALLRALDPEWRLFFEFLIHTGLRISEALAVTWADVQTVEEPRVQVRRQFHRGVLKRPKTRNSVRAVPLSPRMAAQLAARRAVQRGERSDLVFPSSTGGYLDGANVRKRILLPAGEVAQLERIGFHMLRHTCASLLFESGKDIKQVQEWLGHYDPVITLRIYIHLLDRGLGDAVFLDEITSPDNGMETDEGKTLQAAPAVATPPRTDARAAAGGACEQPLPLAALRAA